LLGSLYYEESRALVAGDSNPKDLLFWLNCKFNRGAFGCPEASPSLSQGAPDVGFDLGAKYPF